jgi:predicted molibdopterin-dependent oxidoreductase YjgC
MALVGFQTDGTGRELYHYNSGTMTRKVKGLHAISPEVIAEIHPLDTEKKGIKKRKWWLIS